MVNTGAVLVRRSPLIIVPRWGLKQDVGHVLYLAFHIYIYILNADSSRVRDLTLRFTITIELTNMRDSWTSKKLEHEMKQEIQDFISKNHIRMLVFFFPN